LTDIWERLSGEGDTNIDFEEGEFSRDLVIAKLLVEVLLQGQGLRLIRRKVDKSSDGGGTRSYNT